jgi:hypothetical protein
MADYESDDETYEETDHGAFFSGRSHLVAIREPVLYKSGQPRHSKGVPDKEHPWYHQFFDILLVMNELVGGTCNVIPCLHNKPS